MVEFFDKVGGLLESLWDFILNLLDSLFIAFTVLGQSLTFPLELAAFLPSIISSSVIIVVAIFVAKFIIGR